MVVFVVEQVVTSWENAVEFSRAGEGFVSITEYSCSFMHILNNRKRDQIQSKAFISTSVYTSWFSLYCLSFHYLHREKQVSLLFLSSNFSLFFSLFAFSILVSHCSPKWELVVLLETKPPIGEIPVYIRGHYRFWKIPQLSHLMHSITDLTW